VKHELRAEVIATARRTNDLGLSQGTSGNVSVRIGGGFLVTPSGMPYDELRPSDIVEVRTDGSLPGPARNPSSEWRLHRDIYEARPDAEAIVHVHSLHATALAIHRRGIPAVHYMIAVAGGNDVRCAPYATFGTEELAHRFASRTDRNRLAGERTTRPGHGALHAILGRPAGDQPPPAARSGPRNPSHHRGFA